MMKREIKGLELTLYEEVLENGLHIFIVPKKSSESIYATFTTDFGAYQTEFIPLGEQEFKHVPDGIAHFLEHKMFEQPDGMDVMSLFSNQGVSANANTSMFKTTYLFDGSAEFEKNLTLLLDYVQTPYYTDENVEKEKHIIEQEIDMSADNPYRAGMTKLFENLFTLSPARVSTIGTKESVRSITKEDLYACYHTFYHPSNMFLVITGNVDPESTIDLIRKNQASKTFEAYKKPTIKRYDEPVTVLKEADELFMNITIPKISLGYKFALKDLRKLGIPDFQVRRYVSIYANLKFGGVSAFLEKARNDQVITCGVDYSLFSDDDYLVLSLATDTKQVEEVLKRIDDEVKDKKIDEHLFDLKKKAMIASCIYMSEQIYEMNQKIMGDFLDRHEVEVDVLSNIKSLCYEDFMRVVETLNFQNRAYVVVNPK